MLSGVGGHATSILAGVSTGLQYHLTAAALSSVAAAALSGYGRAPRSRLWWSAAVLLAGWAIGDGVRVAGAVFRPAAPEYIAAWALTGLAIGYVLPAVAGGYVGRRVHRGTGWLAAGAVALLLAPALYAVADPVSHALWNAIQ